MKTRLPPSAYAESLGLLLAWVALWWLASHGGWVSRVFLPTPEATWGSLLEGLGQGGELAAFTWSTLGRMLLGWLQASLLGVGLGVLCLGAWIGTGSPGRDGFPPVCRPAS